MCSACMLVCMESVLCCGWMQCSATEHGRFSLSCMQKLHVSCSGSVWYVGSFKLCCEILLLLNVADMVVF